MSSERQSAECPGCGEELWKRRRGQLTLRNKIVKLGPDGLLAKCPECGEDVPVPFLKVTGEQPPATKRRIVFRAPILDNGS